MIRSLILVLSLMVAGDAQAAAMLDGPTQVEAGQPALFVMKGIPQEHLATFNWQVFNKPADAMVMDLADRQGNPVMLVWTQTAAKCAVIADVNIPGEYSLIVHEFTVGEPNPQPQPQPDPDPDPQPNPGPTKATWGIIIEERDDRDDLGPQRAMVMESAQVRALFKAGHFQCRDDDVVNESGEVPSDMKPYIDRARELGLPSLFLLDDNGHVLSEGPVPSDVPAAVKLIQKYQEN